MDGRDPRSPARLTPLNSLAREQRAQTAVHCPSCAGDFTAARSDRGPEEPAIFCPFCSAPVAPPTPARESAKAA